MAAPSNKKECFCHCISSQLSSHTCTLAQHIRGTKSAPFWWEATFSLYLILFPKLSALRKFYTFNVPGSFTVLKPRPSSLTSSENAWTRLKIGPVSMMHVCLHVTSSLLWYLLFANILKTSRIFVFSQEKNWWNFAVVLKFGIVSKVYLIPNRVVGCQNENMATNNPYG